MSSSVAPVVRILPQVYGYRNVLASFDDSQFRKISGSFAEVDFDNEPEGSFFNASSLKKLSASKLISHVSLLHNAYMDIPPILWKYLMYVAIEADRPLAVNWLLQTWPDENLSIILPYVCQTWKIFVKHELTVLSHLSNSASVILRNFIQPKTHLKKLDLSTLPLVDSQISIICSLVISEASTTSNSDFTIYLNCYVQDRGTVEQLVSAFEAQRGGRSRIELVMKALHVGSGLYSKYLPVLLHFLDPFELEQFSCLYCSNCIVAHAFRILKRSRSLKVLSLRHVRDLHILKPLLDKLMYLERLDIQATEIQDNLEFLLSGMYQQADLCGSLNSSPTSFDSKLKFLDLSCCHLSHSSFLYLARSPHAQTLFTLNLNSLAHRLGLSSVLVLLKACKNLRVLQLEDNHFYEEEHLNSLFEVLSSMDKLKYLNVAFDQSRKDMFLVTPLIRKMPNLMCLQVRFPAKDSRLDPTYTIEVFTEEYRNRMENMAPFKRLDIQVAH